MDYYANRVLLLCDDWLDRHVTTVACDWLPPELLTATPPLYMLIVNIMT